MRLWIFIGWILSLPAHAFNNFQAVPGGVAGVPLGSADETVKPEAWFGERPVMVTRFGDQWMAVIGLDPEQAPGLFVIKSRSADGQFTSHDFSIKPDSRPIHPLRLPEDANYQGIRTLYHEALQAPSTEPDDEHADDADLDHLLPVDQPILKAFGWLHMPGTDHVLPYPGLGFGNQRPANVVNPAFGKVVDVSESSGGQRLIIDHGNGLISSFRHLRSATVNVDDWIGRGEPIGILQPISRKSLLPDWCVYLNGVNIDPQLLVSRRRELESPAPQILPAD